MSESTILFWVKYHFGGLLQYHKTIIYTIITVSCNKFVYACVYTRKQGHHIFMKNTPNKLLMKRSAMRIIAHKTLQEFYRKNIGYVYISQSSQEPLF